MRVAIGLENKAHLDVITEVVRSAESKGFESVWVAENLYYRDAFSTIASLSTSTNTIALATGAINCFSRHPVQTALTASTIANFSNDRFMLGVGTGTETRVSDQMGMDFDRQYTTLREFVAIVRGLLSGERVDFRGSKFNVSSVHLDNPPNRRVPIYIAAVGPTALSLAGEIGDGVLLDYGGSPDYARQGVAKVAASASRKGRNPEDIDIASLIMCSISEDRETAVANAKKHLVPILAAPNLGEALLDGSGADPKISAKLRQYFNPPGGRYALSDAARCLDDELVEQIAIVGNAEDLASRIEDYRSAGVRLPVLVPVPEEEAEHVVEIVQHIKK